MNKKGLTSGLLIVGLFVSVILSIIFVQILADSVFDTGTTRVTTNQTLTVAGNSFIIGNTNLRSLGYIITTGSIMHNTTNMTIGTNNYQLFTNGSGILSAGMITAGAQGANPSNLRLTYSYYSENYVNDSTSRTFLNLIVIFFVIGLLTMLVMYLRGQGLFDSF